MIWNGKNHVLKRCQPKLRLGLGLACFKQVCFSIREFNSRNYRLSAYSSKILGSEDFYFSSRKDNSSIELELRASRSDWETPLSLSLLRVSKRAFVLKILTIDAVYSIIPWLCVLEYSLIASMSSYCSWLLSPNCSRSCLERFSNLTWLILILEIFSSSPALTSSFIRWEILALGTCCIRF